MSTVRSATPSQPTSDVAGEQTRLLAWWAFRMARTAAVVLGVSWTVLGLTWAVAGQDAISDNLLGLLGVVALFGGMLASVIAFACWRSSPGSSSISGGRCCGSRCCCSRCCSPSWRSPKRPGSNRRLVGLDHRPRTSERAPPPNRQLHDACPFAGQVALTQAYLVPLIVDQRPEIEILLDPSPRLS